LVSTHLETPIAKSHSNTYIQRVDNPEFKSGASYEMCDEYYVPLYDLHIVTGRNIAHSDTVREFLINETCLRELGFKKGEDALGIRVQNGMNEAKGTIVGVVKDFHLTNPYEPTRPLLICGAKSSFMHLDVMDIKLNGRRSLSKNLEKAQAIFSRYNPQYPFDPKFVDTEYARKFDNEKRQGTLAGLFAGLAIFISCLGLFGLASYVAESRVKEIGVRKILGASVTGLTALLSKDFIKLVLLSFFVAAPLAWWGMDKWLQGFAYRVDIQWWIFALAGTLAILIALFTVSYQAVRAALMNPIRSLRSE